MVSRLYPVRAGNVGEDCELGDTMTETTSAPFDAIAALAFFLGAIVVTASLGSLLLTFLALIGVAF